MAFIALRYVGWVVPPAIEFSRMRCLHGYIENKESAAPVVPAAHPGILPPDRVNTEDRLATGSTTTVTAYSTVATMTATVSNAGVSVCAAGALARKGAFDDGLDNDSNGLGDGGDPNCKDRVCRKARGECDVAEYCDGASGACHADQNQPDGTSCGIGCVCMGGVAIR